jgi:transposase
MSGILTSKEVGRVLNLTMKEVNRYRVITEVLQKHLKVKDAASILKRSERQVYRIKARVGKEGAKGVVHRGKGEHGARWLTEKIEDKIKNLYKTKYEGFNLTHMTEFLNEEEKIKVSRESLRAILIDSALYVPWKKHPKHRQWREPSSREGQMLQFDTSDHAWLESRGPKLYLIGGIDDATSSCPGARFALSDSTIENMQVLKRIVEIKGIPLVFYCDRDVNFKTAKYESIHQQLKNEYAQTQIERALKELGVRMIYANSPQAKGRVERAWGTFQDRLCSELRLHKISTLEAANHYLLEEYIPKHNRKFSHPAKEPGSAYQAVPRGINLNNIFCIKDERTVASDNTIAYRTRYYQILPNSYRISFVKAKVMVHKWLDGSIHIFYEDKELKHKPIPKKRTELTREELLTVKY